MPKLDFSHDGPLERTAKLALMLCATAVILGCYVFFFFSICALLIFLVLEFIVFLVALRFGLAGFITPLLARHGELVSMFVKNFWLAKGEDYHVPLERGGAPELFAMLDSLESRLKIAVPQEVLIEMNCGAWVRLRGYRRGAGRTTLGVGYDLLAGLNLSEFEAVMAHEMAHAKFVARGLKSWLNGGLARIANVSNALSAREAAYRAQNQSFYLAGLFRNGSDAMTRVAARLVSAYSRQDEFEADRGAAELCGAGPLRTSLLRLNVIAARLARLPWAERVSQIEAEASFSRWLVQELSVSQAEMQDVRNDEARDPYSTHPSLPDRLAALPAIEGPPQNSAPAIGLLAEPDQVAVELIEEIHRVAARQEEKDARMLGKWAHKARGSAKLRWTHVPGLALIVLSIIFGIAFLVSDLAKWIFLVLFLLLMAGGIWAFRLGRYRFRYTVPVPRFADLKKVWQAPAPADLEGLQSGFEAELKLMIPDAAGKSQKLGILNKEAYAALGRCEYLRAHVATRLAIGIQNKSAEAALAHAIACAALQMAASARNCLNFVQSEAGFVGPDTIWGAAWTLTLAGDWDTAEAFLWKKHEAIPDEPTFLLLLAFVQQRRGKLQSAILHAEKACSLSPGDFEALKLLAQCLLNAGRLHAAAERLAALEDIAHTDPEVAMMMVRLRLLQKQLAGAREWSGHLRKADGATPWLIRLGEVFETARHDQLASGYFEEALTAGFFPEAHLGLARIAFRQKDGVLSRRHLLQAANLAETVPGNALGPIPLFQDILGQLMQLQPPREGCRAWIANFPSRPSPDFPAALKGCRVLIYAAARTAAENDLDELLAAMQPGLDFPRAASLSWAEAPKDQQPIRPVHPGVQCVMGGA